MSQSFVSVPPLILMLFAWVAAPAAGQTYRPDRPYRGLFGSGVDDARQSLIASGSAGAGWDNDLIADAAGSISSAGNNRFKGGLGTSSGSLMYALNEEAYTFVASGATALNYYPSLPTKFVRRDYASSSITARVLRDLAIHGRVGYQPYSVSSFYPLVFTARPGEAPLDDENLSQPVEHYLSYSGGATYGRQLTQRGGLSADYSYRGRAESSTIERFDSHSAGAAYTHGIARGLNARFGYHYVTGNYEFEPSSYQYHNLDVGIDFSRAFSFSRRTTFSASTGTSAMRQSDREGFRYYATGSARLSHEMGRTWTATLAYQRGVQFLESWPEPLMSDALSVGVGGELHRRLQFQAIARAVNGTNQSGNADHRLRGYDGAAVLGINVSRYVNANASYYYDRHDIGSGFRTPDGYPRFRDRQGVRLALNAWVPLFARTR